jgi:hypothetical protein
MASANIREAVGVFHDGESLRSAADELMISGFDRADLSILGGHKAVVRGLGHMYDKVAELEDDPKVATRAYVGSDSYTEAMAAIVAVPCFVGAVAGAIMAAEGTTAAAIIGVAAGGLAGGLVGAIFALLLRRRHGHYLAEQIDHGGVPLWVRTTDAAHERRACEILKRAAAEDVHVHDRPRAKGTGTVSGEVYGYLDWLSGVPKPSDKDRGVSH